MSTHTSRTENGIEKRTKRAVEQAMTVVPHGGSSGMFDVHSASGNTYMVDLREEVCTCPDFIQRDPDGSCKHQRRVQLAIGLMDVPDGLRVARCLENSREKFNADVEPESVTIEQQAAQAVEAMTDGGEDIITDGGRDVRERRLTANEIACDVVNVEGAGKDFDAFCAIVEDIQKAIIRAWTNEERRQAERAMGLTEAAVERQAMRACERRVDPQPTRQS